MKHHLALDLPDFLCSDEFGWVRLKDRRVGLVDVILEFNRGLSAEEIAARFPTVSLAQVHHVIAFYLDHQPGVDSYIQSAQIHTEDARRENPPTSKMLKLRQRALALHAARLKAAHAS